MRLLAFSIEQMKDYFKAIMLIYAWSSEIKIDICGQLIFDQGVKKTQLLDLFMWSKKWEGMENVTNTHTVQPAADLCPLSAPPGTLYMYKRKLGHHLTFSWDMAPT